MNYVQYFGSILAPALIEEERAPYEQLHVNSCVNISEANGRVLLGGVLIAPTNFEAVLTYLTQLKKDPQIYLAQNPDGSDYTVSIAEGDGIVERILFQRDLDSYNAFFMEEEFDDGEGEIVVRKRTEMGFGGWPMPNDPQQQPTKLGYSTSMVL